MQENYINTNYGDDEDYIELGYWIKELAQLLEWTPKHKSFVYGYYKGRLQEGDYTWMQDKDHKNPFNEPYLWISPKTLTRLNKDIEQDWTENN